MLEIADSAAPETLPDRLDALLDGHADAAGYPFLDRPVGLEARLDGVFAGGLAGAFAFDWFFVKLLAVTAQARCRGVGQALLAGAETRARAEPGCLGLFLDTFAFQAPGFYAHLGFTEFGRLPGRVPEETRIWYLRRFDAAAGAAPSASGDRP